MKYLAVLLILFRGSCRSERMGRERVQSSRLEHIIISPWASLPIRGGGRTHYRGVERSARGKPQQ